MLIRCLRFATRLSQRQGVASRYPGCDLALPLQDKDRTSLLF